MAKSIEPKIRRYYQPSSTELKVLEHIYRKRYYQMRDARIRKEMEKVWDNAEKNWEAYRTKELEDWQSDYFIPLTTAIIEAILAEMVDQSPRPLILPLSAEDKEKARLMQYIFNYTWDISDGDLELYNVLKDSLILGTGIAQEYYWQDLRTIKLLRGANRNKKKQTEESYEEKEVAEYDDCYMETVKLQDFYIDEKARDINRGPYKARDCIRRYVMGYDSFKQFFKGEIWNPLRNARYVRPGGDTNFYEFFQPPGGMDHENDVEVLWYWSRLPDDALIIVANDVVIKNGANPYKHKQLPFARAVDVKRTHRFYGKGEAEMLDSIQNELNTLRRMVIDRHHLDIDKMFLVSNRDTLDDNELIARPHGIIHVDDPGNVKPVEYGDIPRSVEVTMANIKEDAIRVTGMDDRLQAVRSPGTATEAAILKESTLKRVKTKLRLLERGFLVDIGRLRVADILQFYSQPRMEKILGEAGKGYQEKYREIRLENRELLFDERGDLVERPIEGVSFFEIKPEFFIPVARGGYTIKFEAGATLPISKPLQQTKTTEMFDRLMPLALNGIGYDPVKLGDELLRVNDLNPQDFKAEEKEGMVEDKRTGMGVDLAAMENEAIAAGRSIPPMGTPYASPEHTQVHIAFIKSPQMKGQLPNSQMMKMFLGHIAGEMMAQERRGQGEMMMGQPNQLPARITNRASGQGISSEEEATIPGLIRGGGQVARGF